MGPVQTTIGLGAEKMPMTSFLQLNDDIWGINGFYNKTAMPTLSQERSPADMTEPSQLPSSFPMLSSQWEVCMVSVLPGDDLVSLSFNFSPSASAFECWNYGQMPPYLALS